jgi:DNA-binding transcriptional LysR family regulator
LRYGWVSPPPGSPLAEDMAVILHALDMREAEIVMTGGSLAGVLSFVAQTECLTVLPGETLRTLGPIYGLSAVPIETGTPRRRLGILSRPRVELGFAAREFIRFATEALEDPKTGSA